jgi:DNA topoisomerase-1
MIVYMEGKDEGEAEDEEGKKALPPLEANEELDLIKLLPEQHITSPPPRYTEATLVKALEEYGIGRPSTYAPTLSTIQDRGYVERIDKRLKATEIGFIVNDLLVKHFPSIVDLGFTADMEGQLDNIASGERKWVPVLREFYTPFEETLHRADEEMERVELKPEPTGDLCEKCGSPMVFKYGRYGKFIACSGYPACRNAKSFETKIGVKCPECGSEMVEKKTRRKRIFYSCGSYPACTFGSWNRPLATPCPTCGGLLTLNGKRGVVCTKCGEVSEAPEEAAPAMAAS